MENKKKVDEKAARRKHLGDLAVEVIRLCLRNDYAWVKERRREGEGREREAAKAESVCLTQ